MKKFKIRYGRVLIFFLVVALIVLVVVNLVCLRFSNIFISGNSYLSDQYIIELAGLQDYPKVFFTLSSSIKSKISDSVYIESLDVKKRFTSVYISVVENRPLFYDSVNDYIVLKDGSHTTDFFNLPILSDSVPSDVYNKFVEKMSVIDVDVLSIISEIYYRPNDVDNELFLFSLNDGNYIYVNLDKFDSVNRYFDMVVNFNNHKGVLYLDSGEYFKILDN